MPTAADRRAYRRWRREHHIHVILRRSIPHCPFCESPLLAGGRCRRRCPEIAEQIRAQQKAHTAKEQNDALELKNVIDVPLKPVVRPSVTDRTRFFIKRLWNRKT